MTSISSKTQIAVLYILLISLSSSSTTSSLSTLTIRAADMSALAIEDCAMTCSRFRSSSSSPPEDALVILSKFGFNTVRLRVWVNPTSDHNEGNLTYVIALAKRASNANLSIWLDFHLSDWWADPGHQNKPMAWANFDFITLKAAVANHIETVLKAITAVSNVTIVQIGNEISSGCLWPEQGQECSDSGAQYVEDCTNNWNSLGELIGVGITITRNIAPSATIAVHTDLGNRGIYAAKDAINWYTSFINSLPMNIDFDAIALSYYMQYNASGPSEEGSIAEAIHAKFPTKDLLIAETSYPWNGKTAPGIYPATKLGQLEFWIDTISNASVSDWLGVSWWGGEYAGQSGNINSLFDENFIALPALTQGWFSVLK